jgi:hypothetical protein
LAFGLAPPEPVTLTLHWPGSRVVLPTRSGDDGEPVVFGEPEQARIFTHDPIEVREVGNLSRDLATGTVTLVNSNGGGFDREELGQRTRYNMRQEDAREWNFDVRRDLV